MALTFKHNRAFRVYDRTEIQEVYRRHAYLCGDVLYSTADWDKMTVKKRNNIKNS